MTPNLFTLYSSAKRESVSHHRRPSSVGDLHRAGAGRPHGRARSAGAPCARRRRARRRRPRARSGSWPEQSGAQARCVGAATYSAGRVAGYPCLRSTFLRAGRRVTAITSPRDTACPGSSRRRVVSHLTQRQSLTGGHHAENVHGGSCGVRARRVSVSVRAKQGPAKYRSALGRRSKSKRQSSLHCRRGAMSGMRRSPTLWPFILVTTALAPSEVLGHGESIRGSSQSMAL